MGLNKKLVRAVVWKGPEARPHTVLSVDYISAAARTSLGECLDLPHHRSWLLNHWLGVVMSFSGLGMKYILEFQGLQRNQSPFTGYCRILVDVDTRVYTVCEERLLYISWPLRVSRFASTPPEAILHGLSWLPELLA